MRLAEHVLQAIDDAERGKFDPALLHACIAIDATSKRIYPAERKVGKRYVNCLRKYYWLLEPMLVGGINLVETKFSNIKLRASVSPDLAEVIYEIFRCSHAHGDEVPAAFSVIPTSGGFNSTWMLAAGELHMPDRIIWALLAVAVFSSVNRDQKTADNCYLSLGDEKFLIRDWWGREDDFRPIADRYNAIRVKLDKLDGFKIA